MTLSRSIHVASNGLISFFLATELYSIVYMYHIFFIHSPVNGHLGRFHVLAIVNSAAINIEVHVSFQAIFFPGYMPRSGFACSSSNPIFSFRRFRNLHTVSVVAVPVYVCTSSIGQVLFSPHPLQHFQILKL